MTSSGHAEGRGRRNEWRGRYPTALIAGLLVHASVVFWGREQSGMAATPVSAPLLAALQVELEPERLATGRGGSAPVSHVASPPKAEQKLGTRAPRIQKANAEPRPVVAKPAIGNTQDVDAPDPELTSPDLFALDQELSASGDAVPTLGLKRSAARTRVFRLAPSEVSEGAAPVGGSGDNHASNQAQGSGVSGRGGGDGSGSSEHMVSKPFAFGGTTGAFLGQVCFIPRGTLSVASVGACNVEAEFRTDTINVSPRHFDEGFPGVSERMEWFAVLFSGSFEVTNGGWYSFRLISDDGSYLMLDGRRLIDNDGIHGPISKGARLYLGEGSHEFSLHYFQGPRHLVAIQLLVTPPEGVEQPLRQKL